MKQKSIIAFLCLLFIIPLFASCAGKSETNVPSSTEAYAPVLDKYREIAQIMTSDRQAGVYDGTVVLPCPDGVEFDGWSSGIVEWRSVYDSYGYILKDINADDIPELFWVQEGYNILLAFTISNGEPVGLFSSRPRDEVIVLDSGKLLNHQSGGADTDLYAVLDLAPNGDRLVVEEAVYHDWHTNDAGEAVQEYYRCSWEGTLDNLDLEGEYAKNVDIIYTPITEEEYRTFLAQYPNMREQTEAWKQNKVYSITSQNESGQSDEGVR